ncbi:DEAD/DEAH box helicase [Sulfurospirillum oryzae]|uniref:DEAD/DEAH box helicase n=1 Tax=Sulfurospirillum oryzae TaxID=2976535 RepID=UPI0021E83628|nr:DEAD/DEAH box helicase [Sulfurospirillum oryzae]
MSIKDIIESKNPFQDLSELLDLLHKEGPAQSSILESISYYKRFHPEIFLEFEEKIIFALGLFYKIKEPKDIYSFLLSGIGEQYKKDYGAYLTPVQASIRRALDDYNVISISAPTSAGKSYSIRDFIAAQDGDAVVIVPSRALIAEYVNTMKRKFKGDKRVMISSFVDNIFTSRELRRIFILTPERARDIFSSSLKLNIQVFFFDEAQVSEEKERGIIFDVLIRRIKKHFKEAKLIFAHPFVENPNAQISKHAFQKESSYARSYPYGSVGKLCLYEHSNGKDYFFSPFHENGHMQKNCIEFQGKFEDFAFNGDHTVLVFVSKASIYNGTYLENFEKYINTFPEIINEHAVEIINTIAHLLGADENGHNSKLVSLLQRGVVIHHGSVPLEVRFLVEDFIRNGYAKICFATSTLAQGVNMPFDIVWLESNRLIGENEQDRSLAFKNLIGRAGRSSMENKFDYGYVFTKRPKIFMERINDDFVLDEKSVIDTPIDDLNSDSKELIEAIRSETFDDEKHIPISTVERLSSPNVLNHAKIILDILYREGHTIKENTTGVWNQQYKEQIQKSFRIIFEASINRQLYDGENAVFRKAISIFLQMIQGRSFREIVGIIYSNLSKRDEKHKGMAGFSQPAESLPKSTLKKEYSLFKDIPAKNVSYDAVIFDTYDYFDKVISFSLSDVFMATFKIYQEDTQDERAKKMIELLRFGTNNTAHMLLMRYGIPPENVTEISPYIQSINEENIIFKKEVEQAPAYIRHLVDWYLP